MASSVFPLPDRLLPASASIAQFATELPFKPDSAEAERAVGKKDPTLLGGGVAGQRRENEEKPAP